MFNFLSTPSSAVQTPRLTLGEILNDLSETLPASTEDDKMPVMMAGWVEQQLRLLKENPTANAATVREGTTSPASPTTDYTSTEHRRRQQQQQHKARIDQAVLLGDTLCRMQRHLAQQTQQANTTTAQQLREQREDAERLLHALNYSSQR